MTVSCGAAEMCEPAPDTENGTVARLRAPPRRQKNAEIRPREYLTAAEIDRLDIVGQNPRAEVDRLLPHELHELRPAEDLEVGQRGQQRTVGAALDVYASDRDAHGLSFLVGRHGHGHGAARTAPSHQVVKSADALLRRAAAPRDRVREIEAQIAFRRDEKFVVHDFILTILGVD